jgi:transposase
MAQTIEAFANRNQLKGSSPDCPIQPRGRTHRLLANFAAGLRRDFDAVRAALKLPRTTKGTMYGRAGIELPRARVLHAA